MRLANIMKEFHLLPENLLHMPSVGAVRDLYRRSFTDLLEFDESASVSPTTSILEK